VKEEPSLTEINTEMMVRELYMMMLGSLR